VPKKAQPSTRGKKGRGRGYVRKDGQLHASTTGPRKPIVDTSTWRKQNVAKHRIKFDDPAKQRYLDALRTTGRKWEAEQAAGVSRTTAERHLELDPAYADSVDDALQEYATKRIVQIEKEAIEGHQQLRYGPEGQLLEEKRVYETRLREMFLKRYDPAYQERSHLELDAAPGCVLVPATLAHGEWEKAVSEHDRVNAKNLDPESESSGE
jgi:hypothetical protein